MRHVATLAACLAGLASFAQQPTWNMTIQFRNPIWGDAAVLQRGAPTTYSTPGYEEVNSSIAFGGVAERQFANGCALRIGFEHARNAMDRNQLGENPTWLPENSTRDIEYRQEINTLSVGAVHYLTFDRLEPFFGGEAMIRSVDDLKETTHYSTTSKTTGELLYSSVEKVRYSGGTLFGFAPMIGFRYRVVCDLYLNAEFAPTWVWGTYGENRSSTSTEIYPDQFTYTNKAEAGGTSGGPYFLPRFGVGLSYRFGAKKKDAPAAVPEPMVVPAQ